MSTIAVTGSTGQLGALIIKSLKTKGANDVIALARTPSKAEALDVPARKADYNQPDTLLSALQGVDTLCLVSSSEVGKRLEQHANVINAAKESGVKNIVYTSLLNADTSTLSLAGEHIGTEKLLKESGLNYTLLRNGWYTENYASAISAAPQIGGVFGSAKDGKISAATRQDYAEAAAVVLTHIDDHKNATHELSGDVAFTLEDLANEIGKQTNKSISYTNLPAEEYASVLIKNGVPEGFAHMLADFDVETAKGALHDPNNNTLSTLIGRPTTPLSTAVKDILNG